ncbi:response regulator [Candidatus Omnitrophota bacterium]
MEKRKVLIVDDEKVFCQMVKLNLEETGQYQVRAETSGIEAFAAVKEFVPDVILLDISMPDINGIDVLAELKRDEVTKSIPVIMVTGKHDQFDRRKTLELGAYEYITKPLDSYMIVRQIENILSKKKEGAI